MRSAGKAIKEVLALIRYRTRKVACPDCTGRGYRDIHSFSEGRTVLLPCSRCDRTGRVIERSARLTPFREGIVVGAWITAIGINLCWLTLLVVSWA